MPVTVIYQNPAVPAFLIPQRFGVVGWGGEPLLDYRIPPAAGGYLVGTAPPAPPVIAANAVFEPTVGANGTLSLCSTAVAGR
ncbi:MAG TPA: hypothetical protein VFZ61_08280, partial [Polyangiales bacterium]